ncbi:hypothetical protein BGZ73_006864 [Actinomortierella ambigua]|nr:hypothetical protein BGZ73_006864 [Actinomortierella ambigua]
MIFTRTSLVIAALATLMLATSVEAAPPKGCYHLCVKDGNKPSYCKDQCLDDKCYLTCLKHGETTTYCKDAYNSGDPRLQ